MDSELDTLLSEIFQIFFKKIAFCIIIELNLKKNGKF